MLAVKRSLTIKHLTQMASVSLIATCIFLILQFAFFIENRRADYVDQLDSIAQSVEQSLSQNVWLENDEQIQKQLDSLEELNILIEADVIIPSRNKSFKARFYPKRTIPKWFTQLFHLPITIEKPLYGPGSENSEQRIPMAHLLLKADPLQMFYFIRDSSIAILLISLGLSLILAITNSWFTNRLLILPLKKLAATIAATPQGIPVQLPLPDNHHNDEIGLLVASYNRNQAALEKAYQGLRHLNTRDPLTDLPNRILFEELVNQHIINSYDNAQEFSLIYIGIHSLKEAGAGLALSTVEQLLKITSERLKQLTNEQSVLARLGGEEFIMLIPAKNKTLQVMLLAQKIVKKLTQPIELESLAHHLSINIGIARYPDDGHSVSQLISNAHSALVSAEIQGKNSIAFFEPVAMKSIQQRLQLESEISQGIANREFQLYLQPQVDMRNGALIGAEALVRWHHSDGTVHGPADFVPLAEETGLVVPLGALLFEQICQYLADWQTLGVEIPISINLAAAQLKNPQFPTVLNRLVNQYGIKPSHLKLEVTETGRIEDLESAALFLQDLHQKGFAIALDDFGIGYSNLNYLRLFNVDTLKIDKSFIQDKLPHDDMLIKIVGLIAKTFNVSVIAEGIETEQQKQLMLSYGIHYGQGYLFAPALPKSVFEERYFAGYKKAPL